MADITMCIGTNCPLKETCYRYRAVKDNYRQSMFVEVPFKITPMNTIECKYYWKIEDKDGNK